jgi:hypothetical protein
MRVSVVRESRTSVHWLIDSPSMTLDSLSRPEPSNFQPRRRRPAIMKPGVLRFGPHAKLSMYPYSFSSLLDLSNGLRLYKYFSLKIYSPSLKSCNDHQCTKWGSQPWTVVSDIYLVMKSSKIIPSGIQRGTIFVRRATQLGRFVSPVPI